MRHDLHIVELFLTVWQDPTIVTKLRGEHLRKRINSLNSLRGAVGIFFLPKSLFISETIRDRSMVTMDH